MRLIALLAAAVCALQSQPAFAQSDAANDAHTRFGDAEQDSEFILRVQLDNRIIADGMIARRWGGGVRLPLSQLAAALELPISVDIERGDAVGWFMSDRRAFSFNVQSGSGVIRGQRIVARDGAAVLGEDDIYVDTTELSQWFPINITVALDSLDVMIEPREILPAQERARRESLRQGLQWQYREDISNARRVETPYAFVSAPYVGLRQNVIVGDAEGVDHQYDIRASADVVWMTGRLFVSGEDGAPLRAARVSLGREDPYRRLPGGLSSFTIGDTYTPSAPLVSRGYGGRGFALSTAALNRPGAYDVIVLRGELASGDEVELYRNGILIGSQISRGDGFYEFEDVPLEYGENELRLVFYSATGRVREEVRRYNVGGEFLSKGEGEFELSLMQQGQDVIDTTRETVEGRRGDGGVRGVVRLGYGLTRTFTVTGAIAATPVDESESDLFAMAGARTSLAGVALRFDGALGGEGVSAYGVGASGRLRGVSWGVDHQEFGEGFVTDVTIEDGGVTRRISKARASLLAPISFARIPVSLNLDRYEYEDGAVRSAGVVRVTAPFPGRALVSHVLTFEQFRNTDRFDGEFDVNASIGDWGVRTSLSYDMEEGFEPRNASFQLDRVLPDESALRLSIGHTFETGSQVYGQYTRRFERAELSIGAGYDSDRGEMRGLVTLSFGLGRDDRRERWIMSADELSETGLSRATVFLDTNFDGRRDEGDRPLNGVRVVAGGAAEAETEDDGAAVLGNLSTGRPLVISLDPATLPDPFMIAPTEGFEVVPRPGRMQSVEIAIVQTGGLEGFTLFASGEGERRVGNVRLELVDLNGEVKASTISEFDGFYTFDRVLPGEYSLRLDPAYAQELQIGAVNAPIVQVSHDGSIVRGTNFVVRRIAEAR